jgi:hypothetical protein
MRILREPLLHFLLLGAAIFAAYSFVSKDKNTKPTEIVITQGKIENIISTFTRTWHRPPSEQELQGLIRDYVREEVAYREALALGLDRDDTIIRRRLRQKLEFVSDDLAAQMEPTDADLQNYLKSHLADFKSEPTFTFRQVFVDPQKHGPNLEADISRIMAQLQRSDSQADISNLGDSMMLESDFAAVKESDVTRIFGDGFAEKLSELKPGQWQGPIESGYGMHLVLVTKRIEGDLPPLEEVREAVRREWVNTKRIEANDKFYQALLQRYTITIEQPKEQKLAAAR